MAIEGYAAELLPAVALLGSGIVAVTLFKRLGLGSVLGYISAGLLIGPFGFALFSHPGTILHVAELGVVMFLFVIGLEMQPSRLWQLRGYIFGLGVCQVALCIALLTVSGVWLFDLAPVVALIAAAGFTLSSTAIVFQLLDERGEIATPAGQRVVSILLLEDLAIVPLLALVAFLAPGSDGPAGWVDIGLGVGAIVALIVIGHLLLNPLFRLLAAARAREVMTAAALLVVLGAALLMELGGLSMAMGAFLAGVLLSESVFRHQLEADVEPFRGILLGLFFIGVGMSLDLALVASEWLLILLGVAVYMSVKALGIYAVARLLRADHREAIYRTVLLAQGGEFAFVLYAAAGGAGLLSAEVQAILTAVVILSMALTPLLVLTLRWLPRQTAASMEGVEVADGLHGSVLIIGFGRFGQVVSQALLARGCDITIIDHDAEQIRDAARFGFKIYYGDGIRLDVLRASGAGEARCIAVCIDDRAAINKIVEIIKHEFPLTRLLVRAFDRRHALELVHHDVDYHIRETFESAIAFSQVTLEAMGLDPDAAAEVIDEIRQRDARRFELEISGGLAAGAEQMIGNMPQTAPLVKPRYKARALSDATGDLIETQPQVTPDDAGN